MARVIAIVLLLTACNGTSLINFEAMIPEDLVIYNEGLPRDEQVLWYHSLEVYETCSITSS
jgi:hypothetical protein